MLGREDYYREGEAQGRWLGAGADQLGCAGQVNEGEVGRLLEGSDPLTEHVSAENAREQPRPRRCRDFREWARLVSNQRPLGCEARLPGCRLLRRFAYVLHIEHFAGREPPRFPALRWRRVLPRRFQAWVVDQFDPLASLGLTE